MGKSLKLQDIARQSGTAAMVGDIAAGLVGNQAAQIERLTKLVHILWKHAEAMESIVQVIPEGLKIKTGQSEVLVLKTGGIILDGQRILLNTPGKQISLPF
ncbi:MAG TPA: hypothetical protein VKA90_09325 [Beijerinckiaceae bacterium]|nr:hypothetical protein [Beijerinckiaceae bacterium]